MPHTHQTKLLRLTTLTWWQDIFFLIFILGGLFFIFLGDRPLFVPDEGRYAEIAREMVTSNDYLTPHLNGIKYFEKPVLFYWLEAAAIKTLGLNLWSLRSINALIALLGCIFTYGTARILYNRRTGLLAALILGTSPLYFIMAHMISLDLPVTVFITTTLYAFLIGKDEHVPCKRRLYFYLATASAALAVMTKGLIGLVFPVLIIMIWIIMVRDWRDLKRYYLPSCLFIFLCLTLPWHLLVSLHNPEFFHFYFIEQHFLRYLNKDIGHYQPIWFFIPCILLGFFPWIMYLPRAVFDTIAHKNKQHGFLLLWALLIFVFFSFSKSKLIPYILPVIPPLAILVASYLSQHIGKKIYFLFLATGLGLVILMAAFTHFDTRTIAPLASQIKPILNPADEVITFNQYYQDLPFYLERRISILNWKNELTFGMQHQDTHDWMINDEIFWQRWHSQHRVFVFISNEEYSHFKYNYPAEKIYFLGNTSTTSLISNHPAQ